MLRWRLLLGALFIAAFAGLCWLDLHNPIRRYPPPAGGWLFPLARLVSIAATSEMLWLLTSRPKEEQPIAWVAHLGNLLIMLSNAKSIYEPFSEFGIFSIEAVFFGVILLAFIVEILRFQQGNRPIARLGLTLFVWVYISILLSCAVRLRMIWSDGLDPSGGGLGMLALVSLIAVVKMGDTGAYTVGRLIGRHKMAPRLSPGKTWEGAVGAIIFGAFASWAVFWIGYRCGLPYDLHLWERYPPRIIWLIGRWQWIAYGVAVGIAGMIGDLAESLIKRDCGQKDSSRWMPGFGGVLDLLDSILLAAPVAWLFWAMGWVP